MTDWHRVLAVALGGLSIALLGAGLAKWIGSPVIGWTLGWFSAIGVGILDRCLSPTNRENQHGV